ncbi:MAG TPA: cyclic nucleotide-binding domain-containing protein [Usitatibacter sp.]|nr:cyclic nucleotide-binding domain-containing protein [Usitatibacter sp.]
MGLALSMFGVEANPRVCEAGETIFREFEMGSEMYVVLEGQVELSIDGKAIEVLDLGEPFGEMALIDQAPRVATAVAKTPCKLAVISEKRFLFMVAQTPHFALQIMKVMADRLRRMNARLETP